MIIIKIYTPLELNQASYFLTGLFELEKRKIIKCCIVYDFRNRKARGRISTKNQKVDSTNHLQPKTSLYKLIDKEKNIEINFAVDAYDISYYFSSYAVNNCQFIFKRNYQIDNILPLKAESDKIYPLGLTFMVQSNNFHSWQKLFIGLILGNLATIKIRDRNFVKKAVTNFKKNFRHFKKFKKTRLLGDFNFYGVNSSPFILFQTRCFKEIEDIDVQQINQQRANLIRLLRNNFGEYFNGGFIPDDISCKYFPDCVSSLPSDPKSYLKLVQQSSICIYTRGLANSPAWKLAEYLSQGKCIVAERLTTELPTPLIHGKEIFFFKDESECIKICRSLLEDSNKCVSVSQNARRYYEKNVDPAVNALRIIRLMIAKHQHG